MACIGISQAHAHRPLTVEDILRMEHVGRVLIAPDDRYVFYEQTPPYREAPNLGTFEGTDTSALSKIYVADLLGKAQPQLLFEQRADGGYWLGGFSPQGGKVAVYSLVDRKVTAGVYSLSDRTLTTFRFTPNYAERLVQKPVWLSERELIYSALPEEGRPAVLDRVGAAARVNELWKDAFEGTRPTAIVATSSASGIDEAEAFQAGSLVRADASTGAVEEIVSGLFYGSRLSPSGRYLAALKRGGRIQFAPTETAGRFETTRHQLIVIDLESRRDSVPCPRCNVSLGTMQWSADGRQLTFFAHEVGDGFQTAELFQYTPVSGTLAKVTTGAFWFACGDGLATKVRAVAIGDRVAAYGRLIDGHGKERWFHPAYCRQEARNDWFLIGAEMRPVNLTGTFASVSGDPVGIAADALFLLADGAVWRVEPGGKRRRLAVQSKGPLTPWSVGPERTSRAREEIWTGTGIPRLRTVLQSTDETIVLDLRTERISLMDKPAPDARLLEISNTAHSAVFQQESPEGSTVLVGRRAGRSRPLVVINRHLHDVTKAKQARLDYRLPSGEELSSCLLLPADWTAAKRYPMVVYVYPGHSGSCESTDLSRFDPYNYQLLAARQYAVLFAATPRKLMRTHDGPTSNLAPLLMPAVDRAIQEGYVDGDRMGVIGVSQGYESALQLLTQTDRFRAATVMLGVSNASSHYGTLPLRYRLGFSPGDFAFLGSTASRYEGWGPDYAMGAKPWEEPLRYLRRSPVFQADRIKTPLLVMNSDFDDFPLGQSEEIFSALHRQRKEAVYVTYWGEGHGVLSPANIRDMWGRILQWFDRHLQPPAGDER